MNDQPVVVVVAPGFEEVELLAPVDILRRLGIEVVMAGVEGLSVQGSHGVTVRADMLLVDVDAEKFRGVILPGGPTRLPEYPAVLGLVKDMHRDGKLVAAICAAPLALEAAGVLRDRHITCYPAPDIRKQITSVHSISEAPVVEDGHIITGRGPGAALDFGYALGAYLGCADRIATLKKDMCYQSTAE